MTTKVRNSTRPNQPSAFELDRERVEEDDLDVEQDEQHRGEVEADREAPSLRGGPRQTPDSNGSIRCFVRVVGRVAKRNENAIIVAGMIAAKNAVDEEWEASPRSTRPRRAWRSVARNLPPDPIGTNFR